MIIFVNDTITFTMNSKKSINYSNPPPPSIRDQRVHNLERMVFFDVFGQSWSGF